MRERIVQYMRRVYVERYMDPLRFRVYALMSVVLLGGLGGGAIFITCRALVLELPLSVPWARKAGAGRAFAEVWLAENPIVYYASAGIWLILGAVLCGVATLAVVRAVTCGARK